MGYFLLTASSAKSLIATYQYLAAHLSHFLLYRSSLLSRGSLTVLQDVLSMEFDTTLR